MLEFRILGPLEVVDHRRPVRLGGPRQRATLAILLLNANRVVPIEKLADSLYAGAPPVTAVTQVQRQISELRKELGSASTIETRSPGYVIRLADDQLDLTQFERRAEAAGRALRRGDPADAAALLREALELWRGTPLADLAYEPFAETTIERLEEIRLAALEQRIEAELRLGRHAELVAELEQLVAEHPLREILRAQLMLALYRSGRQAEALEVYRRTRHALAEEFGIEPMPAMRDLERAILTQDPKLELKASDSARIDSPAILVAPSSDDRLEDLLAIAEPLARLPARELVVARLLADANDLPRSIAALSRRRSSLDVPARTAAFTTLEPAQDLVRLATSYDVALVLLDAPADLEATPLPDRLTAVLGGSPADVAVLAGPPAGVGQGGGVFVPFGGAENDWAALELAAWLCSSSGAVLRLVGTQADPRHERRDASRLLADASLAVQRVIGIETEPLLVEPAEEALVAAVEPGDLVVVGISSRWKSEGIGAVRRALVRDARPPVLLVHRGPRPGGLAPRESRTRFSWSIEAGAR